MTPVRDVLYAQWRAEAEAYWAHKDACSLCGNAHLCKQGTALYLRTLAAQDAYELAGVNQPQRFAGGDGFNRFSGV